MVQSGLAFTSHFPALAAHVLRHRWDEPHLIKTILFFTSFFEKGSYNPGWPSVHYVAEDSLEFLIFLH